MTLSASSDMPGERAFSLSGLSQISQPTGPRISAPTSPDVSFITQPSSASMRPTRPTCVRPRQPSGGRAKLASLRVAVQQGPSFMDAPPTTTIDPALLDVAPPQSFTHQQIVSAVSGVLLCI